MSKDEDKEIEDLDDTFTFLTGNPKAQPVYRQAKDRDQEWKQRNPAGYKRDMELLCRRVCGENWKAEYEAMLREEFPEEFEE